MSTEILESLVLKTAVNKNETTETIALIESQLPASDIVKDKISLVGEDKSKGFGRRMNSEIENCVNESINNCFSLSAVTGEFNSEYHSTVVEVKKHKERMLSTADLWNIHRQRKVRMQRRFI